MADKTLYDILEVSSDASPETIRDAFGRLSAKFDPVNPENAANPDARMQHDAIKAAFLTLDNPGKRKQYDLELARKWAVFHNVEAVQPFWNLSKIVVIALALAVGGGVYHGYRSYQKEQVRVATVKAEKAVAAARAKEAKEQASAEADQARKELDRRKLQAMDEGQRREHEAAEKAEKCRLEREAYGRTISC
jgi:curved DNA-binding protein CbpA